MRKAHEDDDNVDVIQVLTYIYSLSLAGLVHVILNVLKQIRTAASSSSWQKSSVCHWVALVWLTCTMHAH